MVKILIYHVNYYIMNDQMTVEEIKLLQSLLMKFRVTYEDSMSNELYNDISWISMHMIDIVMNIK